MTKEELANISLPRHIGIIMDGNGRWAKQRGLKRSEGHKEGAKGAKKRKRLLYFFVVNCI